MSDFEQNPSPDEASDDGRRKRRLRIRLLLGLVVIFLLAGAAWGAWWYFVAQYRVTTDDAYVHGNQISIMPRVSGTVTTIEAEDTDRVRQGQTLVRLDDSDYRVALDQALANLGQTVRQVGQLYAQLNEQKAVIAQRQATLRQRRDDYQRAHSLYQRHAISQADEEQAQTDYQAAQADLQAARGQLGALETQTRGTQPEEHPRIRAAAQQVRQAWLDLQRTTLQAPASGQIAQRSVQLGQQVSGDSPLMAIVPLDQLWVEANYKETELAKVRIGQPVRIVADFYGDDVVYHGRVQGISAGTGSAFELLPPQNATGNWIKVVQRVPVRISLDPDELRQYPLRIGLSLTATIDVHDTSGRAVTEQPITSPRFATPVYDSDLQPINRRIEAIIGHNLDHSLMTAASDASSRE